MASSSSYQSSPSSYIPVHKTQLHPRMQPPQQPPPKHRHRHRHLLLITTLSLLPFLLYLLSLSRSLHLPSSSTYFLLLDIAPSRSQILVFSSLNEAHGTPFAAKSSHSLSLPTGLPGLARRPELVGRVLVKLVEFAKDKVPAFEWKETKVQVFVTGVEGAGGGGEVGKVLDRCRRVLGSSGFLFRDDWASVLEGQDEGLYSWLAVNYALGYIGNKPEETAGVIALGRSAMQVSFASSELLVSDVSRVIRLRGVSYSIYTQSLRQFGQDSIRKSLHERTFEDLRSSSPNLERILKDPCTPKGYERTSLSSDEKLVKSHPAGNFSTCTSKLVTLLSRKQGRCVQPPCEIAPSIFSKLQKTPHPRQRFFLSSQLQGLVPKASVSELESAGHRFCEDDWENLKNQYNIDDVDLSRSCFSHALVATLLRRSFGIPFDEKRVELAAGGTSVDWRLGAFISQTVMTPLENVVENQETQIIENESITYFLLFAVLLVFVLLAAFFVMKLRKPQFKTVYDLEKGRYIVTRVPR